MRFISYINGQAGIAIGEDVLNIHIASQKHDRFAGLPTRVIDIMQSDSAFARLKSTVQEINSDAGLTHALKACGALEPKSKIKTAAPFEPLTIYAVGMNYLDHLEEMKSAVPARPYSFVKSTTSIIGNEGDICFPSGHEDMVDWEAELAFVIGKTCFQVAEKDAESYIFGYMCANDISARDWAGEVFSKATPLETIEQWAFNILGKQYPTFCPIGPELVTSDEVGDPSNLNIQCRVNGHVMQNSHTSKMVFSPAALVSYLSQYQTLRAGDVILSGTMGGVGFGRKPQVFLKDGDVVEVEVEKIGTLKNTAVSSKKNYNL